jgi:chloramphenicol-sensitive protein RarD
LRNAAVPATSASAAATSRGVFAGIACFTFWGLIAAYWKLLVHVDPGELIAHRTVWSLVFLLPVLAVQGRLGRVAAVLRDRRLLGVNLASGALLMTNWLAFVWAVISGHVVESSLGYFLVPICHLAVGSIWWRERLRRPQQVAVAMAAVGVLWLLLTADEVPWIVFALALSWSGYGIVRKRSPMGAIDGLAVETLLFAPLAVGYLVLRWLHGDGALFRLGIVDHVLLLSSGWITAIPLVLFAYAAARIRLSTLGLLQYISPSLQFLLGWLAYGEPVANRLPACICIWLGLLVYGVEGFLVQRRTRSAVSG